MKKNTSKAIEETRRLDELIAHPLQATYNDGLTEESLQALAADIQLNGLREKIHILPTNQAGLLANTILDGHQRLRALQRNGESHTTVIVRYDLAQVNAQVVELKFLEFNANRQHRDLLLQARNALRRYELERNRAKWGLSQTEECEARDRVGKALGMSGRTLCRYWRVLRTPVEVQDAFRAGKLPLVVAEKVADLDARTQKLVAERISAGQDPKEVIYSYLPKADARHRKLGDAIAAFARSLERGRLDLDGRVQEARSGHVSAHLEELRRARALIGKLIEKAG